MHVYTTSRAPLVLLGMGSLSSGGELSRGGVPRGENRADDPIISTSRRSFAGKTRELCRFTLTCRRKEERSRSRVRVCTQLMSFFTFFFLFLGGGRVLPQRDVPCSMMMSALRRVRLPLTPINLISLHAASYGTSPGVVPREMCVLRIETRIATERTRREDDRG